jgi:hypothetical protein
MYDYFVRDNIGSVSSGMRPVIKKFYETGSFGDMKIFVEISGLLAPFGHFETDDAK